MNLCFNNGQAYENNLYFSSNGFNGLFRMNPQTKEVSFLMQFKNEKALMKNIHNIVINHENYLYFIPFHGKGISKYSLKKNSMDFFAIADEEVTFVSAFLYKNKIVLVPMHDIGMLGYFDLDKEVYYKLENVNKYVKEMIGCVCDGVITDIHGSYLKDDFLYISLYKKEELLIINLEKEILEARLTFSGYKLDNVFVSNEYIWLTMMDNQVLKYKRSCGKCEIIQFDCKDRIFFLKELNKELYAFPILEKMYFKYNEELNMWNKIAINKDDLMIKGNVLFWNVDYFDSKMWIWPNCSNGILVIDEIGNKIELLDLSNNQIDNLKRQHSIAEELHSGRIFLEDFSFNLNSFINILGD